MSYTVLARKWRPRRFEQLVGQPHVVQALVNSLADKRLHHAYLFSGTRGVGKTTIARLLAKALNCETGIVAEPCGVCQACVAIDEGRFIDLIEVDAASRTRVDDTRELLDNVQYAPTRGRFKVYLIDEVHMLSNALFQRAPEDARGAAAACQVSVRDDRPSKTTGYGLVAVPAVQSEEAHGDSNSSAARADLRGGKHRRGMRQG